MAEADGTVFDTLVDYGVLLEPSPDAEQLYEAAQEEVVAFTDYAFEQPPLYLRPAMLSPSTAAEYVPGANIVLFNALQEPSTELAVHELLHAAQYQSHNRDTITTAVLGVVHDMVPGTDPTLPTWFQEGFAIWGTEQILERTAADRFLEAQEYREGRRRFHEYHEEHGRERTISYGLGVR